MATAIETVLAAGTTMTRDELEALDPAILEAMAKLAKARPVRGSRGPTTQDKIEQVLQSAERPLEPREILDELIEHDLATESQWESIRSELSRGKKAGRFARVGTGWVMADETTRLRDELLKQLAECNDHDTMIEIRKMLS